jgi:hypothetical protein
MPHSGRKSEAQGEVVYVFSFVLKQKKQKFKATSFLATNYFVSAKTFELAALKQQMFFNASPYNLLTQKDEAALSFNQTEIYEKK